MPDSSPTLTDRLRRLTDGILTPMGRALHRLGVHPDAVTIVGLAVVGVACVFIGRGDLRLGGVLLLVGLPLDALDGAVARARGGGSKFGAFLDSTLDRYADGFIFAALSYYFALQDQLTWLLVAQAALIGSLLVSYTRARGDGVGVSAGIGWFTRVERTIVILVCLLFPALLTWGVLLLAIGTHLTAMQRMWFIKNTLNNRGD